jgi:hypothetical protein
MLLQTFGLKTFPFSICLTLVSVLCIMPPSSSSAEGNDETFSLSVRIQSRHISDFEVCVPVKVNEPFRIVWGNEEVRDSISGVLRPPVGEAYPISLNISEGGGSCRETIEPKLKVGEAEKWSNVASVTFNHIDSRTVVLSKGKLQITPRLTTH